MSELRGDYSARGLEGHQVRRPVLDLHGKSQSVGRRRACEMEARSETGIVVGQVAAVATDRPAMFRSGSGSRCDVGRRRVLLTAPGVLLAVAFAACADKPPPAEVTPFAFPAVGAGQKDTAQFGARSGPTVP